MNMYLLSNMAMFNIFVKFQGRTPPKIHSSPLKNGGWKTILSYLGLGNFSGANCQTLGGEGIPSSLFPNVF